jgi:hypothetical protein
MGGGEQQIIKRRQQPVEKGQSLESYAKAYDPTWDAYDLAYFNWKTRNPNEINRKLKNEVGCYQKTQDGKNFMFMGDEGKDDSKTKRKGGTGFIWIPIKEPPKSMAPDETHELKVEVPDTWIRFKIENEFDQRVPDVRVKITLQDNTPVCDYDANVKSNSDGLVEITDKKFKLGTNFTIELKWEDVEKNRSK